MDTLNPPNVTGKGALTIDEFCEAHDLSRAFFYQLRKSGRGPRMMQVGARRLISIEAAADWRRQMETEAA